MNVSSERSRSLWMSTTSVAQAPPLTDDINADIVVVGSGIAGLSVAYELSKAGKRVIVLERGSVGGGMTARTTAHLASDMDDYYHRYLRLRGEDEARIYRESQAAAIDRIEEIQAGEGIACDFARLNGYLFHAPGTDTDLLQREAEACQRIGCHDVVWAERAPFDAVDTGRCLCFPRQGRFHPLKYLDGLIRCIRRDGSVLYANTPVVSVAEENGRVIVKTESGNTVGAGVAIVATNSPINDWIALHTKQAPYRSYVIAGKVPRGSVFDALYWDTLDPYHYVRLQPESGTDEDWLIVGGEDHKSGTTDDAEPRLQRLEAWARSHVPEFGPVEHRWSGQVMEPVDFAPYIGRNHGNKQVYVATGDSGQGITAGVVAGMLLRDLVLGRDNPWADAYAPERVTALAAGAYLRENTTMVSSLAEYVTGGALSDVDQLQPGQGAILRQGLQKVAAYRGEDGQLHMHSAVCPHAGCIVRWNSFEQSWDCPCHGSQFAADGQLLNGPALRGLAGAPPKTEQHPRRVAS